MQNKIHSIGHNISHHLIDTQLLGGNMFLFDIQNKNLLAWAIWDITNHHVGCSSHLSSFFPIGFLEMLFLQAANSSGGHSL